MATKSRKRYGAKEKIAILREVLQDGKRISDVAETYHVHPNAIMQWRKALFEDGSVVFERSDPRARELKDARRRIERLEEQLSKRDGVVAELAQENIELKKNDTGQL